MYLSIYLPIYLSIYLSVCLSVYLSTCPSASLITKLFCETFQVLNLTTSKTQQFCETSSMFELDNVKNEAILREFVIFQSWQIKKRSNSANFLNISTWQRQKRSNSARLPHFSKLTTSKTKEFCETSFKNGKLRAELTASYQCVLRFFQSICLNYCACHEKVMPGHTKCCTCHAKSSQQTWRSDAPKCNPLRKSPLGPPNSSDEDVSCTAPATENASLQILFKCPTPAIVFGNATKPSRFAHFWEGAQSLAPATRKHIWTSKSGANMWCFVHFDFEMCFVPQRSALFRHRNFQKWSEPGVLCTCWLRNVLRATTACTFSTSQLPPVVRSWCALYILTSKCASGHNDVHFFDSPTPKSAPKLKCFVHFDLEMCFAPQQRAIFHLSSGQLAPHPPL